MMAVLLVDVRVVHLAASKAESWAVRKEFSMVVRTEDWWVAERVAWMEDEMVDQWVVRWVVEMGVKRDAS